MELHLALINVIHTRVGLGAALAQKGRGDAQCVFNPSKWIT